MLIGSGLPDWNVVTPLTPQPDTSLSDCAGDVTAERLTFAERQIDDVADDGAMRRVVKRQGSLRANVVVVLHAAGPPPGSSQPVSVSVSLISFDHV